MPFDNLTDGQCPSCWLDGTWTYLRVNQLDIFECPACRLQLRRWNGGLLVMVERGKGELKALTAEGLVPCGSPLYIQFQSPDARDQLQGPALVENEPALRAVLARVR